MDQLCTSAACACFIGIITSLIGIICPSERLEGQIRIIMSMIFIIVIVKGICNADIELKAPEKTYSESTVMGTENADKYFMDRAENNVSAALSDYLEENGIYTDKISVSIDISENGSIYINEVTAQTDKDAVLSAAEKLKEAVGEEVTVNVMAMDGDDNEIKA